MRDVDRDRNYFVKKSGGDDRSPLGKGDEGRFDYLLRCGQAFSHEIFNPLQGR